MSDISLPALYLKLHALHIALTGIRVGYLVPETLARQPHATQASEVAHLLKTTSHRLESVGDVWQNVLGELDAKILWRVLEESLDRAHAAKTKVGKDVYISLADYCRMKLETT